MSKQAEPFHFAPPEVSHQQQQQEMDEQDYIFCDSGKPILSCLLHYCLNIFRISNSFCSFRQVSWRAMSKVCHAVPCHSCEFASSVNHYFLVVF